MRRLPGSLWTLVVAACAAASPELAVEPAAPSTAVVAPAAEECPWSDEPVASLLELPYENKMISSGQNFPKINLSEHDLDDLSILLHHRVRPADIRAHFGWSETELESRLDLLLAEELAKADPLCGHLPTSMVMTVDDGKRLFEQTQGIAEDIAAMVRARLPEIKKRYQSLDGCRDIEFSDLSLLMLSDVLLDDLQINTVESRFVKAERTSRNGMHYYFAFMQKEPDRRTESFGIYGNAYRTYGKVGFGLYGNRRSETNFNTISPEQLTEWFGMDPAANPGEFKAALLAELADAATGGSSKLSEQRRSGFERLGMMRDGAFVTPVFDPEDIARLQQIAGLVTDDLLAILEDHRSTFEDNYRASPYAGAVTFEEYFMWWYHFLYTATTDILVEDGLIAVPTTGVVPYLTVPSEP